MLGGGRGQVVDGRLDQVEALEPGETADQSVDALGRGPPVSSAKRWFTRNRTSTAGMTPASDRRPEAAQGDAGQALRRALSARRCRAPIA